MYKRISTLALVCFLLAGASSRASAFPRGAVVSQHPIASRIGADVLAQGGNAFDAAAAIGYALGVVRPNSLGLGGGGFALIYLADQKRVLAVDFRERAPKRINLEEQESNRDFLTGPRAGGVPGTVAGLEHMRSQWGHLERAQVISPAEELAREGFPVSNGLAERLASHADVFRQYSSSADVFLPAPDAGEALVQTDLANTMAAISAGGCEEFYEGNLARDITNALREAGGIMSEADLQDYEVYVSDALCGEYRGRYRVCSMPLPSSGGVVLSETLNILEHFGLHRYPYRSPDRLHYLIQALRQGFADRAKYLGDGRFEEVPVDILTSEAYGLQLSQDIVTGDVEPLASPAAGTGEAPETTHYTVVDKEGNIASVTISLNGAFGSGFVIPGTGILLNNTLDDFSRPTQTSNQYGLVGSEVNFPEPGKTPLSSMSPTIVFDADEPILALGSPGGPTIISAVLNVILARLDHDMSLPEAVAAGRVHHQWRPDMVFGEDRLLTPELKQQLTEVYGHRFPEEDGVWSKFYWSVGAIELDRVRGRLLPVADGRSEGAAIME